MPEIHIDDTPEMVDETVAQAEANAAVAKELEAIAEFGRQLSLMSPTIQALASEYGLFRHVRNPRFAITESVVRGQRIWTCESENGFHQSKTSAEHALFLLVDSHRTRIEDTEAFRLRVKAANAGMTSKEALRRCEQIGKQIRDANPKATGEERDALAMAHLEGLEAAAAAPLVRVDEQ